MTATTYAEIVAEAEGAGDGLVLVERDGSRATVTINDPEHLNPLSAALTLEPRRRLEELARDESLRAVILTGTDPAFSAGGDLNLVREAAQSMLEAGEGAPELWRWTRLEFGGIARLIARTDKAFIAAVKGAAAGVGLAFALASDLILVSERAVLVPKRRESRQRRSSVAKRFGAARALVGPILASACPAADSLAGIAPPQRPPLHCAEP